MARTPIFHSDAEEGIRHQQLTNTQLTNQERAASNLSNKVSNGPGGGVCIEYPVVSGTTQVPHGLGKLPQGASVVCQQDDGGIYVKSLNNRFIEVSSSVATIAKFFVF